VDAAGFSRWRGEERRGLNLLYSLDEHVVRGEASVAAALAADGTWTLWVFWGWNECEGVYAGPRSTGVWDCAFGRG